MVNVQGKCICQASQAAKGKGVEGYHVKIGGTEASKFLWWVEGDQPWVGAYHRVHAALHDTTGMTQAKTLPERAATQNLQGSCPGKIACKHAGSAEGHMGMMRAAEV